jgi:hypothetical protein
MTEIVITANSHINPIYKNHLIQQLDNDTIPLANRTKLIKYLIFYSRLELTIVETYVPHIYNVEFNLDGLIDCELTIGNIRIIFQQNTYFNIQENVQKYLMNMKPIPDISSEDEFNSFMFTYAASGMNTDGIINCMSETCYQLELKTYKRIFCRWELYEDDDIAQYVNMLDACLDRVKNATLLEKIKPVFRINIFELSERDLETIFEPFEARGLDFSTIINASTMNREVMADFIENANVFVFLSGKVGPEKMAELFAAYLNNTPKIEYCPISWIISFLVNQGVDLSVAFPFKK